MAERMKSTRRLQLRCARILTILKMTIIMPCGFFCFYIEIKHKIILKKLGFGVKLP